MAVLVLTGSLTAALWLLPPEVDALLGPGTQPDITYPSWLFVLVTAGTWGVAAAGLTVLISTGRQLREAFDHSPREIRSMSAPWQLALVVSSAVWTTSTWTAVAFPREHLGTRYALDGLVALTAIGSTAGVGVLKMRGRMSREP